jgi:hypothetical protein
MQFPFDLIKTKKIAVCQSKKIDFCCILTLQAKNIINENRNDSISFDVAKYTYITTLAKLKY